MSALWVKTVFNTSTFQLNPHLQFKNNHRIPFLCRSQFFVSLRFPHFHPVQKMNLQFFLEGALN